MEGWTIHRVPRPGGVMSASEELDVKSGVESPLEIDDCRSTVKSIQKLRDRLSDLLEQLSGGLVTEEEVTVAAVDEMNLCMSRLVLATSKKEFDPTAEPDHDIPEPGTVRRRPIGA